eukprot:1156886-Pelagomonas_calceolata.AAC.4
MIVNELLIMFYHNAHLGALQWKAGRLATGQHYVNYCERPFIPISGLQRRPESVRNLQVAPHHYYAVAYYHNPWGKPQIMRTTFKANVQHAIMSSESQMKVCQQEHILLSKSCLGEHRK